MDFAVLSQMSRSPPIYLHTSLRLVNGCVFVGFACDPSDPTRRFTVELLLDNIVVQTTYADQYVQDEAARIGHGCHGFTFRLAPAIVESAVMAEAGCQFGPFGWSPSHASGWTNLVSPGRASPAKRLRWLGGLRFSGSIATDGEPALTVMVDGVAVMQVLTFGWAQADEGFDQDEAVRSFDFHLPERFADGAVRYLSVQEAAGDAFPESPLPFVAFPDGLAAAISQFAELEIERLRSELYDHLIPMSMPMANYEAWRKRFPPPTGLAGSFRCAIVLVPPGSVETSLESLETQSHNDWTVFALSADGHDMTFDPKEARVVLAREAEDCDFVVFGLAGTRFELNALQRIAQTFADFPQVLAVYGDVDVTAGDCKTWPVAFPAFDYERMLEQGYCAHLFALRRDIVDGLLAQNPSSLYRLFNSQFDDGIDALNTVVHLPGALGALASFDLVTATAALRQATTEHLARRDIGTDISASSGNLFPAVRVLRRPPSGQTTIVIPTRNQLPLLRNCIEFIAPVLERNNADILIADNDSSDEKTLEYLANVDARTARVLRLEGPFNFARLNNLAIQETKAEYLCLLNNDIEALDEKWLGELLSRIKEEDVGAVGALLLWPSNVIQHGGVVLGSNFAATHAFNDRIANDPGYADLLGIAHECSAVTAACMLTRRSDYLAVGGMDEIRFPISFNDVDYCLRLREIGKRIVITPHAQLLHVGSASRGKDDEPDKAADLIVNSQI